MISVSPVTTASEGSTPTAPAVANHHAASTIQETRLPAYDTAGMRLDALSTNIPAFRMASSSASAHNAAGAIDPADRNSSSARLAISTMPLPASGRSGCFSRRATTGIAVSVMPKSA